MSRGTFGGTTMNEEGPSFILAGNAPYENRGCEAIVRGTVKILRKHFNDPRFICVSRFSSDEQFNRQRAVERDGAITHLQTCGRMSREQALRNFWRPYTWSYVHKRYFRPEMLKYLEYQKMIPHLDGAAAVLSVGGDNYSLDYGIPTLFTDLDDIAIEKGRPIVIWGASVGPFDKIPEYEGYMARHLREVTGIFARESATIDYLRGIDVVENVYPVSDPAFMMDPEKPAGIEDEISIEEDSIGINLSPLMANYVTGGDLDRWTELAASIVAEVAARTGMRIYMIPHVTVPDSNDYEFMRRAVARIRDGREKITLVPPRYNASETKWIIGQMAVFAGARTHATIAALSSGVPTLSFAYSIKARGINRDLFGSDDNCLGPDMLAPETIAEKIGSMLSQRSQIQSSLRSTIPKVQEGAMKAGKYLRNILDD